MLYGEYGRSGVIRCRSCSHPAPPSMALEDRLAMSKLLIRFLPTTNRFRRNPYLNDHATEGDAASTTAAAQFATRLHRARDRKNGTE